MRTLRNCLRALLFAGFLVSLSVAVPGLRRISDAAKESYSAGASDSALRMRNESAFGAVLGEIRVSMADMMFVKTTRYLHAGIAYAPRKEQGGDGGMLHPTCAPGTPTMIRGAERDFRGFLGDIERQVKPFQESANAHVHLDGDELAPWFRVMTLVNPGYVRGYRVGAKNLADKKRWKEARSFLEEGIAKNQGHPELFLLYQSLASFHLRGRTQTGYPWGDQWAALAMDAASKSFALGKAERPRFGEGGKKVRSLVWNDDLEEDFRFSAYLVPLLLREKGKNGEALRAAREVLVLCPKFQPIHGFVRGLEGKVGKQSNARLAVSAGSAQRDPLKAPLVEHLREVESVKVGDSTADDVMIVSQGEDVRVVLSERFLMKFGREVLGSVGMMSGEEVMIWTRYNRFLDALHEYLVARDPHGDEHEGHDHEDDRQEHGGGH